MIEADVQVLKEELGQLRHEVQRLSEQVGQLTRQRPMIVNEHPNIVRMERVQGGEPMIRDKFVPVSVIIAFIQQGQAPESIVTDYAGQLTLTDVYDALSYYHAHQSEIEGYLLEQERALAAVSEVVRSKQAERATR